MVPRVISAVNSLSKPMINLNSGDPDAEAPTHVREAVIQSVSDGGKWTHYWPSEVTSEFCQAVVNYYRNIGPEYKPKNVIPTAGSSPALYVALKTILDKGDEILMWQPSYSGHYTMLKTMGVKMNVAPLLEETAFHPDIDTLSKYITPKTKAVLICSPNNPTGTVFTRKELKAIGEHAIDNDLAVFSDEIYLHFVYGNSKFTSTASIDNLKERTINIMSFSKTFSMTGYRLGYTIVPERYLSKANAIARMVAARPTTFVYAGGLAALNGDMSYVEERRLEYETRKNYFCNALDNINGIYCQSSEGAFYAWFNIKELGLNSDEFCKRLMDEQQVNVRPGNRFGLNVEGYVRAALVQPIPVLKEAIRGISYFADTL